MQVNPDHKLSVNRNKEHLDLFHATHIIPPISGMIGFPLDHPPHNLSWIEGRDMNLGVYQEEMERNVKQSGIIGDSFKPTQDKFIKQ